MLQVIQSASLHRALATSRFAAAGYGTLRLHIAGQPWLLDQQRQKSTGADEQVAGATPLPPSGPLVGFKVLDCGQVVAGNFAGALLSYFGADVIKVEPPKRGDALRHLRTIDDSGTSLWWRTYGRNRRCITVDMHSELGRDVVKRLANKCDVLIENFRPGVMEKWGLGPIDLKEDLIYTRISGYGQTGPKAHLPGYASVCEAVGGLRHLNGYPDRAPVRPNLSLGDSLAGLHAAFGAVMALLAREHKSASGQVVDATISESVFNMLEGCVPEWMEMGQDRGPSGSTVTGVVPSGTWKSKDEHWVVIGGNGNSVYSRLVEAIGRPDMGLGNERYATDSARVKHEVEINEAIEAWVGQHTKDEVIEIMTKARVPAGPILAPSEISSDLQYWARGMLQHVAPPGSNRQYHMPGIAPVLHGTPGRTRWAGPELGQHTEEVLKQELGMDDAEIAKLREAGAI